MPYVLPGSFNQQGGNPNTPGQPPTGAHPASWYASHQHVVPQAQVQLAQANAQRQQLRAHGYDVDATGVYTDRLNTALQNFQKTKGAGAHVWNSSNPRTNQPSFSGGTAPGHPGGPGNPHTDAKTRADTVKKQATGGTDYNQTVDTNPHVDLSGKLPPAIQAIVDRLQQTLNPAQGHSPFAPTIDPALHSAAQANMQYGPVISQLQDQINAMAGAEPGAQANIAGYFAPVATQAATATASDAAATSANSANQAKQAAQIAQSLGLSGSAAGGIGNAGEANSAFANNLDSIINQQDQAQQRNVAGQQAQAQTTESSNNTNALAQLRSQLLSQIAAKGSAQTAYKDQDTQQNFANTSQGIQNESALLNQRTTAALAIPQIAGAYQGLTKTQQGIATTQAEVPGQLVNQAITNARGLQGLKVTAAQTAENIKVQNANIQRILHPVAAPQSGVNPKTGAVKWTAVDPNSRVKLGSYLHALYSTSAGPNSALAQMKQKLASLGYTGNNGSNSPYAFAKSIVDQYWAKSNPNAHYNAATGKYVNNKTGKAIG